MQETNGTPLDSLDGIWLDRAGAPALAIDAVGIQRLESGRFELELGLRQTQTGPAYPMHVPLAIQLEGDDETHWRRIPMTRKAITHRESFAARPMRIDVDASFDLFRLLAPEERPPSLSRLFGAKQQLLVMPAAASGEQLAAWRALADSWQRRYRNIEVVMDGHLRQLPSDKAVWLLGWNNRWLSEAGGRFAALGQSLSPEGMRIGDVEYSANDSLVVVLAPTSAGDGLGFVGARTTAEIVALARKLPHYGRYGRLVFDPSSVANQLKDDLPVQYSPLSRVLGGKDPGPPHQRASALRDLVGVELSFD